MKKKWLAVLLCGCLAFAGCGSGEDGEEASNNDGNKGESGSLISGNKNNNQGSQDENSGSPTASPDLSNPDLDGENVQTGQYWHPQGSVVLGQYTGVSVDRVLAEVSDEDVKSEIDYLLNQHSEPKAVEGRNVVENGDYICVDYTFFVGGEQVDEVKEEYLTVGNGYYDFEENLVGTLIGESKTVECEVQDYAYSDYVGQTGTYIVNIISINELIVPELTDAFIAEKTDFDTVDAYRQDIYDTLLAEATEDARGRERVAAFEKIMENSTFSGISDADIQSYVDETIEYFEQYASMWGMDVESIVSLFYGASYEEFLALAREDGEYAVKQYLILDAVIKDAGITLTDEEYTEALAAYAAENDFASPEEVEETYYKEDLVEQFLRDKAYDMIVDSMVVS
ncbi:MAG: hypothetical protein K2N63_09795 [Lachnospiraceae bacterium]|nr:hypothetical protein [Lachnospiraceae bacterium]